MFLSRGQPVVYYGDEQGFAGTGGDKDARQTLFATQVRRVHGPAAHHGRDGRSRRPLRHRCSAVRAHRGAVAAARGAHGRSRTVRRSSGTPTDGAGVYAFSRVDRDDKVEYLVALNNSASPKTVDLTTLTADATFTTLYGGRRPRSRRTRRATASITVPALSAVVYSADAPVTAPASTSLEIAVTVPAAGAGLSGVAPVSAEVADDDVARDELRVARRRLRRVARARHGRRHRPARLPRRRRASRPARSSSTARCRRMPRAPHRGLDLRLGRQCRQRSSRPEEPEEPESTSATSACRASFNTEAGCAGDWQPDCEAIQLTKRRRRHLDADDGRPAVAGVVRVQGRDREDVGPSTTARTAFPNGANIAFTHAGGPITFYFDPRTKHVQSTAEGPIVTLPGSFQSELGCPGDWSPDCLASMMFDGDKDGVFEFYDRRPADRLVRAEGRARPVAGTRTTVQGGAPGGANIAFTATEGKVTTFRYTLATHVLTIEDDRPAAARHRASRRRTGSTPRRSRGRPTSAPRRAEASWQLYASDEASLALADGEITGGDPRRPDGRGRRSHRRAGGSVPRARGLHGAARRRRGCRRPAARGS